MAGSGNCSSILDRLYELRLSSTLISDEQISVEGIRIGALHILAETLVVALKQVGYAETDPDVTAPGTIVNLPRC